MYELYLEKPGALTLRRQAPVGEPRTGELKLRSIYGGICGSDLRVYKGSINYAAYPLRPGHEVLATVAAGTAGGLKPGDRVVVFPNTFCGECAFCRQGRTNICRQKKPLGLSASGVFAREFIIESKYVVPVPAKLADERAILTEPLAVSVHALKKAGLAAGLSVAVVGAGTEGLLAAALALKKGCQVTLVDVNPAKLAIAARLGPVKAITPAAVGDSTFDVVVEAAGVKASVEQAMQMVTPGGSLVAIGITGEQVDYPCIHIVRDEITIYGTIIYTPADFAEAIEWLLDDGFNVAPVLSKVVPLADFRQAYDDALSGNFAKIVLDFREG